ncbi:MAG: hypothetical protein ACK4YF_06065, partial [Exilispira sp.]
MLSVNKDSILILLSIATILSIVYTLLQYLIKFHPEKKISRIFFLFYTFFKVFIIILIFVVLVYFFYNFYNTFNQYAKVIELKKYVKNLSKERVLAKITILDFTENYFKCQLEIYNLDGKIFKKSFYELAGSEFYLDFVVLNFDYLFIEKGANNIAYPAKIFSDTISYDNGKVILTGNEIFEYLSGESQNFIGLTQAELNQVSKFIIKCLNDEKFAKKNGVRSIVGSALHHKIVTKS